jgi:hypothetical protein
MPGSQVYYVYPDLLIFTHPRSRIPNLKTAKKERDEKIVVVPFFGAINFTKLRISLLLKC